MGDVIEHPLVRVNRLWDVVVWRQELFRLSGSAADKKALKKAVDAHNTAFLALKRRSDRATG